jgi:hypothetical protein
MNGQEKIESLHCLIAVDKDSTEGIPGFPIVIEPFPWPSMIGAYASTPKAVERLREMAPTLAKECGVKIKLCRFTYREQLEEFTP